MDIMVEGEGKKLYKPNELEINLNFYVNDISYEKVLEKGTKSVEEFINIVLNKLGINKEKLKTRNFRISRNIRYDYLEKKEIDNGFDYNQNAMLKMDYSREMISDFIDSVSKLEKAPKYNMNFTIKDKENAKKEVMSEAYNKAKEKAEIIAIASGKKLKDCVKVDFRPFEEKMYSNSSLSDNNFMLNEERKVGAIPEKTMRKATSEVLQTTFTPEEVEIKETLYCLWITE